MNIYRFSKKYSLDEHFIAAPDMTWAVQCFEEKHPDYGAFDVSLLGPVSIRFRGQHTFCGSHATVGVTNLNGTIAKVL